MSDHDVDPHRDTWYCTQLCRDLAVPSTLGRDTPPQVRCDWCGAAPGIACVIRGPWSRRKQPLARFGRFHRSRLEAAS